MCICYSILFIAVVCIYCIGVMNTHSSGCGSQIWDPIYMYTDMLMSSTLCFSWLFRTYCSQFHSEFRQFASENSKLGHVAYVEFQSKILQFFPI